MRMKLIGIALGLMSNVTHTFEADEILQVLNFYLPIGLSTVANR